LIDFSAHQSAKFCLDICIRSYLESLNVCTRTHIIIHNLESSFKNIKLNAKIYI